jgi:general stress protein 26
MTVNLSENHPKMQSFLESHNVGILATASKLGVPHAATMYFVIGPNFQIHFVTRQDTTKHRNISENPQVALAIFDAASQTTVQAMGTVEEVTDTALQANIYNQVLAITKGTSGNHQPPLTKLDAGKYITYQLKPRTLRMAEFIKAEYPPVDQIFEIAIPG